MLPPEHKVFQSSMEDLHGQDEARGRRTSTCSTARAATPARPASGRHLFGDVISSRTRTKRANALAENALQR